MKLIESKTLGTAAASIEFTSIPQTFTDLVVFSSARSTTNLNFYRINLNNSALNFTGRYLTSEGPTSGTSAPTFGRMPESTYTANTFGNDFWYLPNYTTSANKSISVDAVAENNSASPFYLDIVAGLWSDSSAITSVKFVTSSGNFAVGTLISLYGITKGSDGIVTTS
jgi:hypothetical protein